MLKKKQEDACSSATSSTRAASPTPASLEVLRSTHTDFTDAVRSALPDMRFNRPRIGRRRVRQLVEQEFSFKITPDNTRVAADSNEKG